MDMETRSFRSTMVRAVLHGFPNIPGGHGSARIIDGFATCMVLVFLGAWWVDGAFRSIMYRERA
jgi:hypothetical protein